MRTKWAWIPVVVGLAALVAVAGCFPPVDEDVEVRGTLLDLDGSPMAGVEIELYKSTVPYWLYGEDWLEHIFELEGNSFRTITTDANGDFSLVMTANEANNPGGNSAAHFALLAFHDGSREMGILTDGHHFSNEDLIWNVPEMQFWDVGSVNVNQQTLYMDFVWPDLPKNNTSDYLFKVNDGDWAQWIDRNATSLTGLPVEVLNPDTQQCSWQMYAWSAGLLYRSDKHTFDNENIFTPIAIDSITDAEGNELPGAMDEEYTDKEYFISETGDDAVLVDLGAEFNVTAFVVHNAWIENWWAGTATISTSLDGVDWQIWGTAAQGDQENWGLWYHYEIDMQGRDCRYIKIELSGADTVGFTYIGELVAFGT